jgi:hypothetical protein
MAAVSQFPCRGSNEECRKTSIGSEGWRRAAKVLEFVSRGELKECRSRLPKGRRPVTLGGGAGYGARGQRLVTFAPGRLGHHACRHYDRHARCSLQPEPAPRETPDDYGACSAKPGPTLSLGMRESRGREPQWNAGRRVRPQHLWVATSEGVAHAAPAGAVPHPYGADRQALSLPRVCRRSASFLFFLSFVRAAPDFDGSGPHCRIDLTKVGFLAAGFWDWLAGKTRTRIKSAPRE